MIITVTLNPALDKVIRVARLTINGVNRVIGTEFDAGGKGINVSKVVHALGGETFAMGILGGESGMYIQHTLTEMNINNRFSFVDAPTRTNIKILDEAMRTATEINERGEPVSPETLQEVFSNLQQKVQQGDTVVFAGAVPPGTPAELLAVWTRQLKARGVTVCLDTSGDAMRNAMEAGPDLIKPNKEELEEFCGTRLYFDIDVIAAAKSLIAKGVGRVAVSLGAEGALFVTDDQVIRAYGMRVPVLNASGAGDAMMAALTYYLQQGLSWRETIRHAIAVSAVHVSSGMNTPIVPQLEALLPRVRIDELM